MAKLKDLKHSQEIIESYLQDDLDQELSPAELARHLRHVHKSDVDLFIDYVKQLSSESLGDVAIELPDHILKDVIEEISPEQLKDAIEELESDDATDLLQNIEDINEEKAQELFDSLDDEYQEDIKRLRRYDDEEAGAYMQTEVFVAKVEEKISDAIARLKQMKEEGEIENIYRLFVVDDYETLRFSIPLEDLITSDFSLTFKALVEKAPEDEYQPIFARDDDTIDSVIETVENYDLSVVPVIDYQGRLVGRITADDIHDIIQENATEQIYNLAGVNDEAEEENTLFEAGKSRAMWLFLNLFTAIVASLVIGIFDETIQAYVALAVLMPIVASMGGNAGTQTLTVTVRQLALGDIDFQNAKSTIVKEVSIAGINGVIFALVMGAIAFLWFHEAMLGVVIGLSMVINLLCAGLFGALIPLTLKRLDIDPAVGSTVLLTTVTDVVGFFSFLGLAQWILLG
ncbi:magnesium transporter [Sulfurospirillum sp. T05]|uniref:Magnesium transporter MgtE n=1 Tax=Sulfurospirillum tamanense TaxID=2813362 RepID=A0ABS2WQA9_9BACT|nr:magnesium transporter [Sulfurospirillum tamanensis]MBN2963867.1 magnesium transporter [Sulfurospirillum tamanensis]